MACGSCGGNVLGDLSHPITSGDLQEAPAEVPEADATHKVLVPAEGGAEWHYYGGYREARIAWMLAGEGAKLRKA